MTAWVKLWTSKICPIFLALFSYFWLEFIVGEGDDVAQPPRSLNCSTHLCCGGAAGPAERALR